MIIKIRPRKDRGKVECDYTDPRDGRRYRRVFDSESEAHDHAKKIAQGIENDVPLSGDRNITWNEYTPKYLTSRQDDGVAQRTYQGLKQLLTNYVLPTFGPRMIRQTQLAELKALLGKLRRQGYAPNTVRLVRSALREVLSSAAEDGIIETNPILQLAKRKNKQAGKVTSAERRAKVLPLTVNERDAFLGTAAEEPWKPYAAAFETMLLAGLRPSECYALHPTDLDLGARKLKVAKALDLDRSIKDTKTHETRTVLLSAQLTADLKAYLHWLRQEALRRGWGELTWLFPTQRNTPLEAHASDVFHGICDRAQIARHRVYDCRHSYASIALTARQPIGFISKQLGHKTVRITLDVYAKWLPSEDDSRWTDLEPEHGTRDVQSAVNARNHRGGMPVRALSGVQWAFR